VGAIIGPLVAGALIALDWTTPALFYAAGAVTLIGAVATLLMPRGRAAERIAFHAAE